MVFCFRLFGLCPYNSDFGISPYWLIWTFLIIMTIVSNYAVVIVTNDARVFARIVNILYISFILLSSLSSLMCLIYSVHLRYFWKKAIHVMYALENYESSLFLEHSYDSKYLLLNSVIRIIALTTELLITYLSFAKDPVSSYQCFFTLVLNYLNFFETF